MIEGEHTLQQKHSDEQFIRGKHIIDQIFKVQFLSFKIIHERWVY